MRNSWFPFQKEESMCEKVLFCFHHAGGAASCYHPWAKWSEELEVVPCELPGNGCRMSEKFCFDMKWLVKEGLSIWTQPWCSYGISCLS